MCIGGAFKCITWPAGQRGKERGEGGKAENGSCSALKLNGLFQILTMVVWASQLNIIMVNEFTLKRKLLIIINM